MVLIFDFSLCSCPVCYRWCLCTGDQATVYISVVCVCCMGGGDLVTGKYS